MTEGPTESADPVGSIHAPPNRGRWRVGRSGCSEPTTAPYRGEVVGVRSECHSVIESASGVVMWVFAATHPAARSTHR